MMTNSPEDNTTAVNTAIADEVRPVSIPEDALRAKKKKAMLKHTALYASSKYLSQAIGIVNSFALRRFMGPTAMGVWSVIQVILNHGGQASIGTTRAMARDYPFYRGKGDHDRAENLKDLTLTFTLLMMMVPAAGIGIYLTAKWSTLVPAMRIGLIFICAYLFVQRFYDLTLILLRSDKRFEILSMTTVLESVGGILITFSLVYFMNIYGLMIGTILVTLGMLLFIYKKNPYHFRFYWNNATLWRELKLGVPLFAQSFLLTLLRSLDSLIIAKLLGFLSVGYYSIALMSRNYANSLPLMFAHVWYPHLQEDYGRHEDPKAIRNYLLTPLFGFSIFIPFLCGLAIFTVPALVHLLLPKYIPGLMAMKIYLIGSLFMVMGRFSNQFLITLDKYWITVPIMMAAIAVNAALNGSFIALGWGIEGVAFGTAVSLGVYGISSFWVAMKHCSNSKQIAGDISGIFIIALLFWAGIGSIDYFVSFGNVYASSLIKIILFLAYAAPFLWHLEKKTQVLRHLKDMKFKKKEKDARSPK